MYHDASWLDTAGRLLFVVSFLVAGLCNLTRARIDDHIARMAAFNTPYPAAAFWIGISLQFTGCALLASDWHAAIGALCLIVFVVTATLIFHRFWSMRDPGKRNGSRINLLNNLAIVAGLLLLFSRV